MRYLICGAVAGVGSGVGTGAGFTGPIDEKKIGSKDSAGSQRVVENAGEGLTLGKGTAVSGTEEVKLANLSRGTDIERNLGDALNVSIEAAKTDPATRKAAMPEGTGR